MSELGDQIRQMVGLDLLIYGGAIDGYHSGHDSVSPLELERSQCIAEDSEADDKPLYLPALRVDPDTGKIIELK